MKLTTPYLQEKFNEFNKTYFNCSLETPTLVIGKAKRSNGTYEQYYYLGRLHHKIIISDYWERTEKEICTTLLHEMIHQYIRQNKIKDSGSHGYKFMSIAEDINERGGWNIGKTGKSTTHIPKKPEKQYLLAFKWTDGTYHLTKYNKNYKNRLLYTLNKYNCEYFTFVSYDAEYAKFICVRKLRSYTISKEKYEELFEKYPFKEVC